MLTKAEKINLFVELVKEQEKGANWLSLVPRELSSCMIDNPYNECLLNQINLLSKAIFTEVELEDVCWFLDWLDNLETRRPEIVFNDEIYRIGSLEDYVKFLELAWE